MIKIKNIFESLLKQYTDRKNENNSKIKIKNIHKHVLIQRELLIIICICMITNDRCKSNFSHRTFFIKTSFYQKI